MQIYHKGKQIEMYDAADKCQCIEIHSIDLISAFLSFEAEYAFRGQANENWKLKTTLERFIEKNPTSLPITHIEEKIINNFKLNGKSFLLIDGINVDNLDVVDLKALIQHYGGPTRLLDFTSSFMNALSFAALDDSIYSCAVFCIRRLITEINSDSNDLIREMLLDCARKGHLDPSVEIPEKTDTKTKIKTHFSQTPCLRNIFQHGFFFNPECIDIPFEKVLANNLGLEDITFENKTVLKGIDYSTDFKIINELLKKSTIIKIIFPSHIKKELRKVIYKNISMRNLFPDISGVTKSLYEIDTSKL